MPRLAVPQRLLGHLAFELRSHPRGDHLQDGLGLRGLSDRSRMQQRNQAQRLSAGPAQRHAHVAVDAHVDKPLIAWERPLNLRDMVAERPGDDVLARRAAQVVGEVVNEHAFVRGGDRPPRLMSDGSSMTTHEKSTWQTLVRWRASERKKSGPITGVIASMIRCIVCSAVAQARNARR